jgi:hypothetical protein
MALPPLLPPLLALLLPLPPYLLLLLRCCRLHWLLSLMAAVFAGAASLLKLPQLPRCCLC